MSIQLNPEQIAKITQARLNAHLTQLELSNQAKVSLRTIKDLEAGRRTIFYESTIIILCRTLGIDYVDLTGHEQSVSTKVRRRWKFLWGIGLILLSIVMLIAISKRINNKIETASARRDWVDPTQRVSINAVNPQNPVPDCDWRNVNYWKIRPTMGQPGKKIAIEIKWSYHFVPGSNPEYFISAYTQWDPDSEIRLLHKDLRGDGFEIINFEIKCPPTEGVYIVRVFLAPAWDAMPSFYGHPGDNQVFFPCSVDHLEIPIEVVSRK
jgi:transcriptional regulator with XRE-family HTH domain